ncbi:MAG: metallo-beta-lactamase [Spirochaetes bacterium]|nr:MAG: metallo-beta-lactamase [Spirochaetota bacterium]
MSSRIVRLQVGPIGENVYAIDAGGFGILVDPGDSAREIMGFLEEKGIKVACIVLTHGHLDHTAALPELLPLFGPSRPKIAIHTLDAYYLGIRGEGTNKALFEAIRAPSYFKGYWRGTLPEPDFFLEDGQDLEGSGWQVIHSPGHSPGSICLYEKESGSLISGDTLFRDGVGRTDGPDSDFHALERSLQRLARLPAETKVFPGHGTETTIGRELSPWGR